jgi:hypothetical protein
VIRTTNNKTESSSKLFKELTNSLEKELLKTISKKRCDYQIIFNIFDQFQFVETDWSIAELVNRTQYSNQFKSEFLHSYFLSRSVYENFGAEQFKTLASEIVTELFAKKIESVTLENNKSFKPDLLDFQELVNEVLTCEKLFYRSLIKIQGLISYGSYEFGVVQLQLANYKMTLDRILSSDFNLKVKAKAFLQFHLIENRFKLKSGELI